MNLCSHGFRNLKVYGGRRRRHRHRGHRGRVRGPEAGPFLVLFEDSRARRMPPGRGREDKMKKSVVLLEDNLRTIRAGKVPLSRGLGF